MGLLDLLPLLEGWDYSPYVVDYHTIVKGLPQFRLKIEKPGWVLQFGFATTDAFGSILITVKGPGGTDHPLFLQPEFARLQGAVQTDPSGYLSLYNRPIPASTAGLYFLIASPGHSGSPLPLIGDATFQSYLETGSTQTAALLTAFTVLIEIKDKRLFLASLKKFQIGGLI